MVEWHHQFNGCELGQSPGDGEGQGSLECCSPCGCEESHMTWWLNNNISQHQVWLHRSNFSLCPCQCMKISVTGCPDITHSFHSSFLPWTLVHVLKDLLSNVKVLVTQSCLTLYNAMNCSLPGSSVHGILQARILEEVAIPFSRRSSQPKDQSPRICLPCCRQILYHLSHHGSPLSIS